MRENALGPVSIRRNITPILILLSVMDGSIFFRTEIILFLPIFFLPCFQRKYTKQTSFSVVMKKSEGNLMVFHF